MEIRLAASLQKDSIVDGEGIRAVLWTQGCSHNCIGCHNKMTHSFEGGALVDIEEVYSWLDELEGHDGITLSGGDPMYQPLPSSKIAKYAHDLGLNVWCYSGFTFEQLISKKDNDIMELLKNIDVLVDGPFILSKKSYDTKFRGSTNQRVIDVPKSLKLGKTVIKKNYEEKIITDEATTKKKLYI